ncbi:hypothetical protein [Azospirillum rugosum]|uniref:Beta-barrel assembly machine subunit BamF n=1 Tax=Azospirillum rugosum TaxID=416170 RepID=A0ABS4SFK3_9PROT|nr:hypothetical protein [Azospirillum rugosum]MBP2291200.1 hypothetical protein [Azospirillum rugosum]MDQ0524736.1 hypothetical protein [Azospirillum rugosum]
MTKAIRRGMTAVKTLAGLGAAALVALALPACSDRVLDTGLFGAVTGADAPVKDDTTLIRGLKGENREYPNLGTVPPRPTDLRTEAQRQEELDKLAEDRASAKKMLPNPALPTPADVPPAPDITPGKPSAKSGKAG